MSSGLVGSAIAAIDILENKNFSMKSLGILNAKSLAKI
jgi:hypothetical protein